MLSFDLRKLEVKERGKGAISRCHNYLFLRASLCKILVSSFAHQMDFAHDFSVDFF